MQGPSWISEFHRHSLLNEARGERISAWARQLVECLTAERPDQEIHVFGVSRIPKMPNYLLASSSEQLPTGAPLRIHMTEKTADLFLAPTKPGVRILQEELPMVLYYDLGDGLGRRLELGFYEAICFDGQHSSLVFGLILNDSTMSEFLPQDEIAELFPLVRSMGIPLLELYMFREAHALLEEEARLMTGVMRESHPELLKILPSSRRADGDHLEEDASLDAPFLQYASQQLRLSLAEISGETPSAGDPTQSRSGIRQLTGAQKDRHWHETLIKSFANLASLLNPQIKPRVAAFSVNDLMRSIVASASPIAALHHVQLHVDELPGNTVISGDQETTLRLCDRLFEYTFPMCAEGNCWIRLVERTEQNYFIMEIEDSGPIPPTPSPTMIMRNLNLYAQDYPRLRRGGGILFRLVSAFLERTGGRMHLSTGMHGGFAVQFAFPLLTSGAVRREAPAENAAPPPPPPTPAKRPVLQRGSTIEVEFRRSD